MSPQHFDVTAEITQLQQLRHDRRRKKYSSSLQDFRDELIEFLKHEKSSYRLAAEWLRSKKKFKVSHTTIMRFAKQQPELQEVHHAKFSQTKSTG